jgi:hypothetical protein
MKPPNLRHKTIEMSATITLQIDTELAGLLAKKAAAQGVTVEQYALDVIRRAAQRSTIRELFADVGAEFEASGRTEEELQQDIEQVLAEVRAERRAKERGEV